MSDDLVAEPGSTILEHLNDLRVRLTWAAVGFAAAVIVGFIFAEDILNFLIEPYGERLQTLSPTEGIQTYFRVALFAGAILAMPWMLTQLWLFIRPGLHEHEKKYVYIFVPAATLLFLTGVAFSWFILLPSAVNFLSTFMASIFSAEWTSQEYIGFATSFLFWIGVSFEIPLLVYFLSLFGILSAKMLREHWRIAIVAIAVLAAVITPSIDPVTMLLTMLPLLLLYIMSIFLASIGYRQFERKTALDIDQDQNQS
jgi:sec-independent protein translocase protein TatC